MLTNQWKKSSRSGHNGACVEARDTGSSVGIKDSKFGRVPGYSHRSPEMDIPRHNAAGLIAGIKAGMFDAV